MVAIQIVSDLHLESPKAYDVFEIPAKAPYLALLGDIGCTAHGEEYLGFLRRQLARFRIVFLVLGNHEPWHGTWAGARATLRQFAKTVRRERQDGGSSSSNPEGLLGEFVLLDRARYDMEDGVTVLGCTLFSQVPPEAAEAVSFGINDFYYIEDWTVEQHDVAFRADIAWLNQQVAQLDDTAGRKVVILTHYSPTLDKRAVNPRHRNSPIQPGFATDVSSEPCFRSASVKVWAFGHTHFNCDFTHKETGTRVIANQRGSFFSQSKGYLSEKVVEI